jgi:hypothetical protein
VERTAADLLEETVVETAAVLLAETAAALLVDARFQDQDQRDQLVHLVRPDHHRVLECPEPLIALADHLFHQRRAQVDQAEQFHPLRHHREVHHDLPHLVRHLVEVGLELHHKKHYNQIEI